MKFFRLKKYWLYIKIEASLSIDTSRKRLPNKTIRQALTDNCTVDQFLRSWLVSVKKRVAFGTYETYEETVTRHLVPALGHMKLRDLSPLDIEWYYTHSLQNGRLDGKGGLSAQSMLHQHRLLKGALQEAVRWELLSRNPADAVKPPAPTRNEMRVLDELQLAHLLKSARNSRAYIPILLAATTGARRGEVLALRWDDVDLAAGTLTIKRSLEHTHQGLSFKEPKTHGSRRTLPLPRLTLKELSSHKKAQTQERKLLGAEYDDLGLICAQAQGAPMSPGGLSKEFSKTVRKAGLPRVRLHDLRHSHASHLLRLGIHPKVVSERLGHSTVSTTLDIYSHLLPGIQEEAARKIDASLRAAMAMEI